MAKKCKPTETIPYETARSSAHVVNKKRRSSCTFWSFAFTLKRLRPSRVPSQFTQHSDLHTLLRGLVHLRETQSLSINTLTSSQVCMLENPSPWSSIAEASGCPRSIRKAIRHKHGGMSAVFMLLLANLMVPSRPPILAYISTWTLTCRIKICSTASLKHIVLQLPQISLLHAPNLSTPLRFF